MILDNKTTWQMLRGSYLKAARECRDTLIKRGYRPGDVLVHDAVNFWVKRARRAHAIAMGRDAITDFLFINEGSSSYGKLYAK